jgi:hypothetical protein
MPARGINKDPTVRLVEAIPPLSTCTKIIVSLTNSKIQPTRALPSQGKYDQVRFSG